MTSMNYPPVAELALRLKDRFGIKTLVETGTYHGTTTDWAARHFDRVVTIDINPDFQEIARTNNCASHTNIEYLTGDSRDLLPRVIADLREPAIVWVDAHNANKLFGDGPDDCPVLQELGALLDSPYEHLILIDDAHCFIPPVPYNAAVWPEIWQIKAACLSNGYTTGVAHDVIACVPLEAQDELPKFTGINLASLSGLPDAPRRRFSANLLHTTSMKCRGVVVHDDGSPPPVLPEELQAEATKQEGITELLSTRYGTMLVPRYDTNQTVVLRSGWAMSHQSIALVLGYLSEMQGSVFVDVGANVGSFGFAAQPYCSRVYMIEAQRMLFYMLAGSIALNGWKNIWAYHMAASDRSEMLEIPQFDYGKPCSFGSIEFGGKQIEPLEQERGDDPRKVEYVQGIRIDDFSFPRLDVLKIDVEGMEGKVLTGARATILMHKPVILVEHTKTGPLSLTRQLNVLGYDNIKDIGDDLLAIPEGRSA